MPEDAARDLAWDARRARRTAAVFVALTALTLGLVALGALVRAHGAGLACPDWPRCFGVWLPALNLRVGFEWAHRAAVLTISTIFTASAAWVAIHPELRAAARRPLAVAFLLLAVQIVLGGLTVLLSLASWTVTAHLVT